MRTSTRKTTGTQAVENWLAKVQFKGGAAKRATFYEKMSALINDGVPLDAALRQIHVRYAQKKRAMAPLFRVWTQSLDEGKTFAEATKGYVGDTESIIIAAGEKSGDLPAAFEQAAMVARASSEINKAVRVELATPAIQVVLLVCLLVGFSTTMAPGLMQAVPWSALDDSQRALFTLAKVVSSTWFIVVPALAVALWVSIWSMPRYTGSMRRFLDKIPPWSVYRIYCGSTFMISLAALIKAGVPIEAAIRFIRGQSTPWMRESLSEMIGRLRAGADQGTALDVGLLGDDLSDTVAIYAKTTNFDAAMNSVGQEAVKSGIADIKLKAGAVRFIATILIGVLVGWMFDAMLGLSDATTRAQQQQQVSATR